MMLLVCKLFLMMMLVYEGKISSTNDPNSSLFDDSSIVQYKFSFTKNSKSV